jgi:pimeloyl-ACP methyl ester carboxylesterase
MQPVRFRHDTLVSEVPEERAKAHARRLCDDSPIVQLEISLAPRPTQSKAPVLVMGAEDDRIVPIIDVVRTARTYGTQAHVFRGMGHDLMLEARWREPLDLMLDWLERTVV